MTYFLAPISSIVPTVR